MQDVSAPLPTFPPQPQDGGPAPFIVDVLIGGGGARSIAGPGFGQIKENNGIRNFMQLIVLNDNGTLFGFQEARRESAGETAAVFTIQDIPYGKEYHFLLLMGHWEHDGSFKYYNGVEMPDDDYRPPTLLAAGLTSKKIEGSGTVRITMWPIVVDTKFVSGPQTREPVVDTNTGEPKRVPLIAKDWSIAWTINHGIAADQWGDLETAKAKAGGTTLFGGVKTTGKMTALDGNEQTLDNSGDSLREGNVITQSLTSYTNDLEHIGTEGFVNFNLAYVPFSKDKGTFRSEAEAVIKNGAEVMASEWIIRNGVNDKAQNNKTNFATFHQVGGEGLTYPDVNGNGDYYEAHTFSAADDATPGNEPEDSLVFGDERPETVEVLVV
ncbi:MAG: hypothetical protein LBF74_03520, partial [Treponema sp.]|nr:hypothetical protein [Treponema sp.]